MPGTLGNLDAIVGRGKFAANPFLVGNAAAVGTRPAEVCGWYKKPPSSRSAITLRIVAVLSVSSKRFDIAREDTGSPVSI
jgi:hypothetical protein